MNVYSVDERDSSTEMTASGYRIMIVNPGRRISAFNLDGGSASEALEWAKKNASDGGFSVAARFDEDGGGVTLIWLTPPPEVVMERIG
ncbi:hypothetical protein C5D04_10135 [Rathayibacter sp. AY1D2]|jgi:hypothetical protein|nr:MULTISPECIES: hypothetical protein [unclassified Rathayibacter]PPI13324.1 hypothetical protein C5D04_10135 [Rathayibacter sp. AY1D2]PPG79287.1 hypothetical protein C5C52_12680 [Rathayibacter sp. AY1E5]PPH18443.1 hypothetical protein C5C99_13625 [Rathayibacter sp. AY1C4]PPH27146.1 hypothetical protein C5C37_14470 [Rathayibacter sp. AY1F9]PPH43724.1 hypothetical protein C5D09_14515 [Rathayibacter sp. AY1C9]